MAKVHQIQAADHRGRYGNKFGQRYTSRMCRLSDEKMSDFDPKMGIFQPFEPVFWSKGCSFLCFGNFVGRDECDFQPMVKNQNIAV